MIIHQFLWCLRGHCSFIANHVYIWNPVYVWNLKILHFGVVTCSNHLPQISQSYVLCQWWPSKPKRFDVNSTVRPWYASKISGCYEASRHQPFWPLRWWSKVWAMEIFDIKRKGSLVKKMELPRCFCVAPKCSKVIGSSGLTKVGGLISPRSKNDKSIRGWTYFGLSRATIEIESISKDLRHFVLFGGMLLESCWQWGPYLKDNISAFFSHLWERWWSSCHACRKNSVYHESWRWAV